MKKLIFSILCVVVLTPLFFIGLKDGGYDFLKRSAYEKYVLSLNISLQDIYYDISILLKNKKKEYPTYSFTTSTKNYIKLKNQVNSVLENYLITGNQFQGSDIEYNAKVSNNKGKSAESKIKLFGMNPDHFRNQNGHSFRAHYKGDWYYGKKKENFLKPNTRGYGIEYLWNILFQKISKGIKIDYNPVRVLFNNIDYGFYYREPFFDKYLIELNGFRDGEILEIYKDSIKVNHLPEDQEFSNFTDISSYKVSELVDIIDSSMVYSIIALNIISGNSHSIRNLNLHWYYNPVINRLQPTVREAGISNEMSSELVLRNQTLELKDLVEFIVNDNHIIQQIYNYDQDLFIRYTDLYLKKYLNFFEEDKILQDNEVVSFFTINPTNNKFFKYYSLIKSNIEFIKPMLFKKNNLNDTKETIFLGRDINFNSDITYRNKKIVFTEGFNIEIENNAIVIFENCDITLGGSNLRSKLSGSHNNSGSLVFIDSNVTINQVDFIELQNPKNKSAVIPSAITFYQSSVNINNSRFISNLVGDDYINFFRCDNVSVSNSLFENVLADAIDSDFSKVTLNNLKFNEIGNDAIDLSGSFARINDSEFNLIGDKCISIGEDSSVNLVNNFFQNSEISIVVKDGSIVESMNNKFLKNKLDYVFYIKKPYYGPPSIKKVIEADSTMMLIESNLKLDIQQMENFKISTKKNIESIMYGRLYGKKS